MFLNHIKDSQLNVCLDFNQMFSHKYALIKTIRVYLKLYV